MDIMPRKFTYNGNKYVLKSFHSNECCYNISSSMGLLCICWTNKVSNVEIFEVYFFSHLSAFIQGSLWQ